MLPLFIISPGRHIVSRTCLKKAFCKMCVTICGRFCPDEDAVAGYGNRIRTKYTAKWDVQIVGMIFQTGSSVTTIYERSCFALLSRTFIIICYIAPVSFVTPFQSPAGSSGPLSAGPVRKTMTELLPKQQNHIRSE